MAERKQQDNPTDFYEELHTDHQFDQSYHETISNINSYSDTGLREDEVHKLTDDIYNPLPPANHES